MFIFRPTFNSLIHKHIISTTSKCSPVTMDLTQSINISIILYNCVSQSPFAFVYNRIQGLTALVIRILSRKSTINSLYNCFSIKQKLPDMRLRLNQTVKSAYVHNRALCSGSGSARVKKLCWSIMGHLGATTHDVEDPLLVCRPSSTYSLAIIRQD